ncbi:glycosyltransferase family 39 protein [Thiomicrorhabdus sp. 6S3-12]|uniref:glycosyltransferase family 39 protein n=1 Tax=Thiomicrorhabdus sp. 6S3-12 TaxID=2819681 RepID=UPI001AADF62C|nr:glycosyltransferase family 39 protein [Thiomicrorhabdus sp. 6S3-12]MBO1923732.1 glycosyltransferase family 39 protein [Thiomicrorhabdus sp. 6S3-12]
MKTLKNNFGSDTTSKLFLLSLIYFSFNAVTQYLISGVADKDQAEQLLFAQDFLLGYGPQPPLYSWIAFALFQVFGEKLIVLLLMKATLFSLFILALLKTGEQLGFDDRKQVIAVIGVLMIPFFLWESQRDLSHSVLASVIAAWLLFWVLKAMHNPSSLQSYVMIGLLSGLGLISKYNLILLITASVLALLMHRESRQVILNRNLIVAIFISLLIIAPHLLWVLQNLEFATKSASKLDMGSSVFDGVYQAAYLFQHFLNPLWILALLILPYHLKTYKAKLTTESRFLLILLLMIVIIVLAFVIGTSASEFNDRWYMPLLFFVPLIIAHFSQKRFNKSFIGIGIFFIVVAALLLPGRTIISQHIELKYDRSVYPYKAHFSSWGITAPDLVIADTKFTAGNLKEYFQSSKTVTYLSHRTPSHIKGSQRVLIVCTTSCSDAFRNYVDGYFEKPIKWHEQLNTSTQYFDLDKTRPFVLKWALIKL